MERPSKQSKDCPTSSSTRQPNSSPCFYYFLFQKKDHCARYCCSCFRWNAYHIHDRVNLYIFYYDTKLLA